MHTLFAAPVPPLTRTPIGGLAESRGDALQPIDQGHSQLQGYRRSSDARRARTPRRQHQWQEKCQSSTGIQGWLGGGARACLRDAVNNLLHTMPQVKGTSTALAGSILRESDPRYNAPFVGNSCRNAILTEADTL